ncbi:UDP-N-acetylmuramoyl-tripeptide--D-alanyl-D-alanine ligase [Bacteroidales bacterium OttesenSCG-928-I14]|nr:UDP-N-acetylmuramoyl-tripeptide--D-alanyl-D-alanine ligase [Bacteroidales bacterium OttesenSCG-928-I14]
MDIKELYKIYLQHPVVSTDSRNCPKGALFFALKGERFDANDYIEQVLQSGAAYAIGDKKDLPEDSRIIKVDNVLKTLQELANYHRKQMNVKVIGITGTNGKTTTKELLATALGAKYKVLYTLGNLNNHIGVPLTLLRLTSEHQYAIVEMGANHPHEIMELCSIAEPDFGLITNVGKAHLEGFGSFEGVIRTKTELYDFLRDKDGIVFANLDNNYLKPLYPYLNTITYGSDREAFVSGKVVEGKTLSLSWSRGSDNYSLTTNLVGAYNFENVLAAISVASYFGVDADLINEAIAIYSPSNSRSEYKKTLRNELIIDAYNANPTSMRAALENFSSLDVPNKMVILGEMKELGKYSAQEHRNIIDFLADSNFQQIILVGESFANPPLLPPNWNVFNSTELLMDYLSNNKLAGYNILIKGSRGNQLEKVVELL